MSDSFRKFHRVSIVHEDGSEEKYNACVTTETNRKTGAVVYRIFSRVLTNKCSVVFGSGNQAADIEEVEARCVQMYWFDKTYGPKPAPKPGGSNRSKKQPPAKAPKCGRCADQGWYEDEYGYQITCECRGKFADF